MNINYYMPTKVVAGKGCLVEKAALLKKYGPRALIMTGSSSAKRNGSLVDAKAALDSQGIAYLVFDKVQPNPSIQGCRAAAAAAISFEANCIVAIGGGSALDAAKAAAVMARNELEDHEVFKNDYPGGALPVIAIPTTAGTGSEVTQYAILTNDAVESKTSISWPGIFPVLAFLDSSYTASLPHQVAANTALDALSHAVEGYLSVKADPWSRTVALKALTLFGTALPRLGKGENGDDLRDDLLLAANMAGVVIAQTGTTIVHAMGYSLTYFKDIDHGRANGLLLGAYLTSMAEAVPERVREVLSALACADLASYKALLDSLLGSRDSITAAEIKKFSAMAIKAKHVKNTARALSEADISAIYTASLVV